MIFPLNNRIRQCDIDINKCNLLPTPIAATSPIDAFLLEKQELLKLTNPSLAPSLQCTLSGLIFLGIISSCENYYRKIISSLLSFDPNSRLTAEDKLIQFGAIDWYSIEEIGNAFVDDGSLANSKSIREHLSNLIGINVSKKDTIEYSLNQFNAICQIRHCLVHANGQIRAANAKKMSIDRICVGGRIELTLPFLHETIQLLEYMIRETNVYLLDQTLVRMFKTGKEKFTLNYSSDEMLFGKFINLFMSTNDGYSIDSNPQREIYDKYVVTLLG